MYESKTRDIRAAATVELTTRVRVAIIANSPTPYRTHLHRRLAAEIPEIELFSVFTHEAGIAAWDTALPPQIQPVYFGAGELSSRQAALTRIPHEWRKAGRIIRWMKQQQIRAIVIGGYNDVGRIRIISWARKHHIPSLLFGDSNILGDRATGWRRRVKQFVVPRVLKQCTAVLPCGTLGRQYFAKYGVPPERTFFFPYEPEYAIYTADNQSAPPRSPGRKQIIFCARLIQVKRADLAIRAFAALAPELPDWDLAVAGEGPLQNDLQALVPNDLRTRVHWLGFVGESAKVAELFQQSDILVLPSDYEPWALVINEACASGLAIVCTNVVGAAAELVRDGVNGRLVPPNNLDALVSALRDVMQPENLSRMKAASLRVLEDWRHRGDPVDGLRQALQFCNVI
jgi:glycosyltransferase involved in cell wall biosynthesis